MVFLQHRERLSGLWGIWYELENKIHPRSQWKVKHKVLFPSLDTEAVREEAGEPGTRNCPALGASDCCASGPSAFWSAGGWGLGLFSCGSLLPALMFSSPLLSSSILAGPPACPHFPQPSSLLVHSVIFHPLRVKCRGVVALCDISDSWVSPHPALRSEVHTGPVLAPVETACLCPQNTGRSCI